MLGGIRNGAVIAAVAGVVALGGCSINSSDPADIPVITGNTFDLHNDLAVTLPVAERINISYEYVLAEDFNHGTYVEQEGVYEGVLWWYRERTALDPEQFLAIHLLNRHPDFEEGPGDIVKLSRTNYTAQSYCLDLTKPEEIPDVVRPYVETLVDLDYPISSDLYIRRFVLRDEREGNERTDVIYARDIVRLGYTCDAIGDLMSPNPDVEEVVQQLVRDAQAAFEVMT